MLLTLSYSFRHGPKDVLAGGVPHSDEGAVNNPRPVLYLVSKGRVSLAGGARPRPHSKLEPLPRPLTLRPGAATRPHPWPSPSS